MAVRITLEFEGAEFTLAFNRASEAISVERTICIACGVPWGSVTRLVDATGAVYSADPALFPDGKRLQLEVVAIPRESPPDAVVVAVSFRRRRGCLPHFGQQNELRASAHALSPLAADSRLLAARSQSHSSCRRR